ncbi:50S ribosomal protein L3 [bacterium]|nr:50S ribosomal protein L3 [bacterium]
MKAILGRKVGMSQTFSADGAVVPVTLILANPNTITVRRTDAKDPHNAVQLALLAKEKKKGQRFAARKEFAIEVADDATQVDVSQFTPGDIVEVSGISKGKGYQGVVKRHHFKGGPASHGHRHALRQSGSIGSGFPQHVFKGKRMAGRMGADRVTVKNLEVVSVDQEANLIAIKGAVPGKRGSIVEIRSTEEVADKEDKK